MTPPPVLLPTPTVRARFRPRPIPKPIRPKRERTPLEDLEPIQRVGRRFAHLLNDRLDLLGGVRDPREQLSHPMQRLPRFHTRVLHLGQQRIDSTECDAKISSAQDDGDGDRRQAQTPDRNAHKQKGLRHEHSEGTHADEYTQGDRPTKEKRGVRPQRGAPAFY